MKNEKRGLTGSGEVTIHPPHSTERPGGLRSLEKRNELFFVEKTKSLLTELPDGSI